MAESIGLRAVLDVGNFTRGLGIYTGGIDQMNRATGNFASTAGSQFVGLGQGVLKFGAIAGAVAVGGMAVLTAGIAAAGKAALDEVAKFERMTLSITNLVAREISGGQLIEQSRQARIQLTEKEAKELEKLQKNMGNEANSRDILSARIQEQKERIRQLTDQYGENGLVVIKERAELEGMNLDLNDLNDTIGQHQSRITELTGKEGQLTTVLEKVRVGQMSMAEAMGQAAPRAQELIKWIQMLAIQSPFNSEGIQMAFQTALAYGFTTEQAQRLTEAEVDFVAATGKTAQAADLIALALGQIQARGKLSAQELRQLSEQGIGTNRILEDMGFSLDDVTNGLVPVDQFIEAVIKDMEIFKGAAKDQANTFSGLISSLEEVKSIGLREFFTGTFEAIRPYLSDFVSFLTSASLETGNIRALGDTLGQNVGSALQKISGFIATIRAGGLAVFSKYLGTEGIPLWYELKELIGNISSSLSGLGLLINTNLSGPMSDFTGNIIPLITQGLSFLNEHFEEFKGALAGIGAVLGGAVFAALVAGLLSLLTPINLIIAGSALLGAAWAGNWGNIRDTTLAILDQITQAVAAFQAGGLFGARSGSFGSEGLLSALGISPDVQATIQQIIQSITTAFSTFVNFWVTNWPTIQATALTAWAVLQGIFAGISNVFNNQVVPQITMALANLNLVMSSLGISWGDVWNAVLTATGIVAAGIGALILGLIGAVTGLVGGVASAVSTLSSYWVFLQESVGTTFSGIQNVIIGFSQFFIQLFQGEFLRAFESLGLGIQGIAEIIVGTIKTIAALVTLPLAGLLSFISGFVKSFIGFFQGLYNELVGNSIIPDLINKMIALFHDTDWAGIGKDLINSLITGLQKNAGKVLEFLKNLARDSIKSLMSEWGMGSPSQVMIDIGAELTRSLAAGAAGEAQEAENKLLEAFTTMIQKPLKQLKSLGLDRYLDIKGLIMGRLPELNEMLKAGTLNAATLRDRVMEIGEEMGFPPEALDQYVDWDKAVQDVTKAYEKAKEAVLDVKGAMTVADIASQLAQFGQIVIGRWADPLQEQIGLLQEFVDGQNEAAEASVNAAEKIKKNSEAIADNNLKLQELNLTKDEQQIKIDEQVEKLAELTEEYGSNSIEVRKAQLELDRLKLKMTKISREITNTQGNTTKLEQEIVELQLAVGKVVDPNEVIQIGDMWIKASEAQELLTKKLEEQKAVQEEQAKLAKQQADLAYLQSQLSLIDMIKKAGLDPKAIFQGITFGLTASVPDMIAATQQAVQALINQVNQGLQIASPSKVMAKAGRLTMAGLAQGITQSQAMVASSVMSTRDMLQRAFTPVTQSLLSAGPSVQGGAVTNNTYYDFNMNVNTGASPQAVIRQYEVMRGMVGA